MGTRLGSDVAMYLVLAAIFALVYGGVTAIGFWLIGHLDRRAARRDWHSRRFRTRGLKFRLLGYWSRQ